MKMSCSCGRGIGGTTCVSTCLVDQVLGIGSAYVLVVSPWIVENVFGILYIDEGPCAVVTFLNGFMPS